MFSSEASKHSSPIRTMRSGISDSEVTVQPQCSCSKELSLKIDQVFKIVISNREEIKGIKKILLKKDMNEIHSSNSDEIVLPLKTREEFLQLESNLGSDSNLRGLLIRKLSTYGGTQLSRVVHGVMNALFSPTLARQFSLAGKFKFKSTLIFDCVLGKSVLVLCIN